MKQQWIKFKTKISPKYTVSGALKLKPLIIGDTNLNNSNIQSVLTLNMIVPPIIKPGFWIPKGRGCNDILML